MDVDEIRDLYYNQQLSTTEIGKKLGKTVWQIIKFMKKSNLPRRKANESFQYVFSRKPLSFSKIAIKTRKEKELYIAGSMIYWAEGVKTAGVTVDLANSDPKMVRLFIQMLRNIYHVQEQRIRALIYCYANQNYAVLLNFWSKVLNLSTNQFIKPYIRQDFDPSKIMKIPYGVVHVRYNDKKLFAQIQQDIDIISRNLLTCWGGRVDKYTGL